MRKITILIALFISVTCGCQNSDLEVAPTENLVGNEQLIPLRETFDFTYKGQTYSSLYHMENDTLMILEDEQVAALYDQLQELPELATYVTPEGNIEYYDTSDELLQNKQFRGNNISTRSYTSNTLILYLYQDYLYNTRSNGNAMMLTFNAGSPISVPNLDTYNFEDKLSSLRVLRNGGWLGYGGSSAIILYRNKNYEAQSITFTFINTPSSMYVLEVENLRNYKVKKGINWNDRVSSFRVVQIAD